MYNKKIFTAISLTFTYISLLALSSAAISAEPKMEKCMGIVKAGKADGQAIVKGKKVDWIYMPAGQCMKFVGGKVVFEK